MIMTKLHIQQAIVDTTIYDFSSICDIDIKKQSVVKVYAQTISFV